MKLLHGSPCQKLFIIERERERERRRATFVKQCEEKEKKTYKGELEIASTLPH